MMRILHVISTLPVGGAENVLLTTLRHLDQNDYQCTVCCIQDKGVLAAEVEKLGISVIPLNKLKKGGWDGSIIDDLVEILTKEKIDLVHSHLYHANLYARLAAKRTGIPSVITIHNSYIKVKWYRRLLNWYLARYTAKIIAVSDSIRDDIIRIDHVPPAKVETILNGIDTDRCNSSYTQQEARRKLGLPEQADVLITIGRLVEQKGHRILIEAMEQIQNSGVRNTHAVFVGDGPLRNALEQQANNAGLKDKVHFLGSRTDIGDILRAGDLYVMPSLWEGLGLALLEGMEAGLPVLASSVGGMIEVLDHGRYGHMVPAGDATALANKLRALLENPDQRWLHASDAMKRVKHFSAEKMVAEIERIYATSTQTTRQLPC